MRATNGDDPPYVGEVEREEMMMGDGEGQVGWEGREGGKKGGKRNEEREAGVEG